MMTCPDCGLDHTNQFTEYPEGATVVVTGDFWGGIDISQYDPLKSHYGPYGEGAPRVLIPTGSYGQIVSHCDDGRVLVQFEAEAGKTMCSHSFHRPETYFMVVIGPTEAI